MKPRIYGIETEFGYDDPENLRDSYEFLPNGGLLYVDIGQHPEYSTPECRDLRQLVAYDKAGEIITGRTFPNGKLFKNNGDIYEGTHGCHENYLIKATMVETIAPYLIPFLVTRTLFTGAGGLTPQGEYVISPRALKIRSKVGYRSTENRSIVNTKDEPLADPAKYTRLHLILGDANMSEVQTYLKFGTTSLVLDLIEKRKCPMPSLRAPVETLHEIAQETSGWTAGRRSKLLRRRPVPATDIQRIYRDAAHKHSDGSSETTHVLELWSEVLDALDTDPESLCRWLDWCTKAMLFKGYKEDRERFNINLQYHDVDRERGHYYALQRKDLVDRLVTDEDIAKAVDTPPRNTRAWFRGNFVKSREQASSRRDPGVSWDWVGFVENEIRTDGLRLPDPFDSYDEYVSAFCRKPPSGMTFASWFRDKVRSPML